MTCRKLCTSKTTFSRGSCFTNCLTLVWHFLCQSLLVMNMSPTKEYFGHQRFFFMRGERGECCFVHTTFNPRIQLAECPDSEDWLPCMKSLCRQGNKTSHMFSAFRVSLPVHYPTFKQHLMRNSSRKHVTVLIPWVAEAFHA